MKILLVLFLNAFAHDLYFNSRGELENRTFDPITMKSTLDQYSVEAQNFLAIIRNFARKQGHEGVINREVIANYASTLTKSQLEKFIKFKKMVFNKRKEIRRQHYINSLIKEYEDNILLIEMFSGQKIVVIKDVLLGSGSYKKVYKGRYNNKDVAIAMLVGGDTQVEIDRETQMGQLFNHQVGLQGIHCSDISIDLNQGFLVNEFYHIDGTKAFDFFNEYLYSEEEGIQMVADLLKGLSYIHHKNFVHLDIKPGNILIKLVQGRYKIVLADYGLMETLSQSLTYTTGHTFAYCPPEVVNKLTENRVRSGYRKFHSTYRSCWSSYYSNTDAAKSHDYFSLGASLFEMFRGKYHPHVKYLLNEGKKLKSPIYTSNDLDQLEDNYSKYKENSDSLNIQESDPLIDKVIFPLGQTREDLRAFPAKWLVDSLEKLTQ